MKPTSSTIGNSIRYFLAIAVLVFISSCASVPKSRYFDQIMDTQIAQLNANLDPVIQKADILSITVTSLNPEDSKVFNAPSNPYGMTSSPSPQALEYHGYLVDPDGNITFPVLGGLHVAGLTKKELSDSIVNQLTKKKLLLDPIVTVRSLNFHVTILGEVLRPAVVPVPNEKISILEAIGMAGDMTIYAKRDNVLLIREEDGKKIIRRLNLNSQEIFSSQYFYLKTNDVIYVESNKAKVQNSSRFTVLLPTILSALTLLVVLVQYMKL